MNKYVKQALGCYVPGREWVTTAQACRALAHALFMTVARLLLLATFPISFPALIWLCKKDEELTALARARAVRRMTERWPGA